MQTTQSADDDNAVYDARYIQQVTVTFGTNGNSINDTNENEIKPATKDVNSTLGVLPEVAQSVGSDTNERYFMGWFDNDGKQYTAETVPDGKCHSEG